MVAAGFEPLHEPYLRQLLHTHWLDQLQASGGHTCMRLLIVSANF